jgi:hypothetical protein
MIGKIAFMLRLSPTKWFMTLRSPAENENTNFVMPAWLAGIHQVRKDASGNIHVNLDSSTPCWNDVIEGTLLEVTEVLLPSFSKGLLFSATS